jgi:predicted amidohydrolase
MRAYMVQPDTVWEDRSANFDGVEALVGGAWAAPGDLVVLPEMFDTGFSFNLPVTADTDGRTLAFLRRLATTHRVTVHGGRTVLGPDGRGLNRSTIIGPDGSVLAEYDKQYPFTLGPRGLTEADRFRAGDRTVTYAWSWGGASIRVACAICYDLRFPELFRAGLDTGAEMFVVPANWPDTRLFHWRTLLIARAIENQAYVLGVNRVGDDPTPLHYPGASLAVGPRGDVLGEGDDRERVVSVEIDPTEVSRWRERFPAWRDRAKIMRAVP